MKFLRPFISLYKNIPQSEDITGGPEPDIGKDTAWLTLELAIITERFAIPHMIPYH